MKQILFFLLLCLSTTSVSAQDLLITDGTKTRSIKNTSFLQLALKDPRLSDRTQCSCMQISGTLLSHTKDSLTIQLNNFAASFDKLEVDLTSNIDFSRGDVQQRYAISDIITLKKYRSKKYKSRKGGLAVSGAILITTGIITAAQFALGGNSRGRKNLLISGGAQVVIGITLASLSAKKTYHFKKEKPEHKDPWRVK